MLASKRCRWVIATISDSLGVKEQVVERFLQQEEETLKSFLEGNSSKILMVLYQTQDIVGNDDIKDANPEPSLFFAAPETDKLKDKACVFIRNLTEGKKNVNLQESNDNDIVFFEISKNPLVQMKNLTEFTYLPMLETMDKKEWGIIDEEIKEEFLVYARKFEQEAQDSLSSMVTGNEYFFLEAEERSKLTSSGNEGEKLKYFDRKFSLWLTKIKDLLNEDSDGKREPTNAGPRHELDYWKTRMQKITSWCEQLKSKDFQSVRTYLFKNKQYEVSQRGRGEENISKLMLEYNRLDLLLTDRLNESKDNVKYLSTLEKFIEPLYTGTPQQIIDTLPPLMNAIKMIHTIARFYNTADKMTGLFIKITNQMITNCQTRILDGKKVDDLWNREPKTLIKTLSDCITLNKHYKDCYKATKDKVADMPKGKSFDFSETQIFGKFDLFCRRLLKIIDIFKTIDQFNTLEKHNLEGMEEIISKFKTIIDDFKKKGHDLLEYQNNNFDRVHVKFNVDIQRLEIELQNFIDKRFNHLNNIEYSLKLLHKFENTLKRESLKHNLQSKYNHLLQSYATELDNIHRIFTDGMSDPPLVRNMPPEAAKIIWAKHLFQKITGPIHMFPETVLSSNEMRKYYGSYNRLGKQLTVYEMFYFQYWSSEIEKSKAALQATIIAVDDQTNPQNPRLVVNFDPEIMRLIREAKCLSRVGIDIPESAKIILLQEEKFKQYKNELEYMLKERDRIISKIKLITQNLLKPHVDDLQMKLKPGMITLTWTSMNIDSFLTQVHSGLQKLEQLIINVNDIIENRIESNLKSIRKVLLVSLPEESKTFSLDQFVMLQEDYIKSKTEFLMSKNLEIERAVDDLLQTILVYPLDPEVDPPQPEDVKHVKRFYFWFLYQVLLHCTQKSLDAMKYRVCGKRGQGNQASLKPFFEVNVHLNGNQVLLNPSLDEIQKAINRAATAVLSCSKKLYNWDSGDTDKKDRENFYDMIAQDKEIVKVILLLTGSIQGTRNKVNDFLSSFTEFQWLWTESIADSLKAFAEKHPTLQNYEDELKKFSLIEEKIERIPFSHKIGAMELLTTNLVTGLKQWGIEWKIQYAQDLHKRARSLLDSLSEQTNMLETRLKKEVKDIDSLGYVMETLEEIRKHQSEIDMHFNPVFEMYFLLDVYLPGGITDKDEMDSRSMLRNEWEKVIEVAEIKQKELQHKQGTYLKDLKSSVKEFIKDVQEFRKDYEINGPMVPGIQPREAMERLRRFEDEFSVKYKFYKINKSGEDLFGLQNQKYPELEKTEAELKNLKKLYSLYADVNENLNKWSEKPWIDISVDMMKDMEEQVGKYGDQCLRLPRDLKEWQAFKELQTKINGLKEVLPIIRDLKKPSIKELHWKEICRVTGKDLKYNQEDNFYLSDLIEANLLEHVDDLVDICESADKQLKIEQSLNEIETYWFAEIFEFSKWGTRDMECILNGMKVQTIQEKLEEDQMTLATLNAQRHVTPFKPRVENLIKVFDEVSETLDSWIKVQMLWTSMEAVFTGGDIAKNLPLEAKKFIQIDKNWLKIMEKAVETKKVIGCCQNDMLKDFLPELMKNLEICQKSLEKYLEGKRKKFPRFYFVANPTLLKILSQGSEPTSIQDDFEKLFDAINRVTFKKNPEKKGSNEKIITELFQIIGQDSEKIELTKYVKCEGFIEGWLKNLEINMQDTVKDIIKQASGSVMNKQLRDFVKEYPSQVALIGIQLLWTAKVTEGLERVSRTEKTALDQKKKEIQAMLNILSDMCLEPMSSNLERLKFETLVTIQVHQVSVTNKLNCKDVNDFEWQKQTRIYWRNDTDSCFINITDWECPYSYEFLGAKERLCITPLTDRCYITLAQAMSMYYGGAPAGPAGTGKTETVKDLGRTLGIFVIVTNCSDQHKYRDMAKIFKGLVQSGLWGCFDEFNRINLDTLSVVAMQVEAITSAKKQHQKQFMFPEEVELIDLVPTVGYFITMNPGYAGRQELPENLKVLFRGVTMMVPDREIIIQVKLAAVGYKDIDNLAKKFNVLYRLCEEQLSKQKHYDFGLRNILSVLRTAGNTKRVEKKGADEEMLLMRSLRDMNLSKLVADDIPLFNGLLRDIFPRLGEVPKKPYDEVENKAKQVFDRRGLIFTEAFNLKVIQLYETANVRHGFMLVGPSGSGKTTITNVLTDTLSDLVQPYRIQKINPKAIRPEEMYGEKSEISDDWTPGIFSTIWEKANVRASKFITWICFDGPVDAIWIENLNTVLDDNKILTLANGSRIPMTENCKLVFEVENLNNASPATVSRCGQVYVSDTDLSYEPVISGWCLARKLNNRAEEAEKLQKVLSKYFETMGLLESIDRVCKAPVMDVSSIIKVTNTLNLLTGILQPLLHSNKTLSEAEYEKAIIYAITWGLGGILEIADRNLFHEFLWSKGAPLPAKGKESENVFDYFFDAGALNPDWKPYTPEEFKPPEKFQFSQLLIPTVDSIRSEMLLKLILVNQDKGPLCSKSVLLIGGAGTSKTSSVLMYSAKFKKDEMLFKKINFSSATRPAHFQASIETECDFKIGKDFAPPGNKQMTVFIDDINMPQVNNWGDQETLEIVRQLIENGGFYMLDKAQRGNFKMIKSLQYIGAMNHPGGGRNDIPNRLKRQFMIFNMTLPQSVESIYGPIIRLTFKPKYFTDDFNKIVDVLPTATVKLWNKVKNTLLPTPSKFHYIFNMRELARVFKGILQVRRDIINNSDKSMGMKPPTFLVGLWRHEAERTFVDKLTNQKDKDVVINFIQEICLECFPQLESDILDKFSKDKYIFFCDFLRQDVLNEDGLVEVEAEKVYEAIGNMEALRKRCNNCLDEYNVKNAAKQMPLVLFDDAIRHLLRISRIVKMPRSSCLLVGVGGSGKQSLVRLASDIGKHVCYQMVITRNFAEKDLREEIHTLYDLTGRQGKHVSFIMTDAEVKKEEFLEYINMILSTGEIPGLIAKDEKESWLGDIRSDYLKEKNLSNYDPQPSELYAYFVDRVRDNLHVVLCFSPVGQKFRERARKFPSLFNECSIDWFLPWPEEALVSVADTFLKGFDLDAKSEIRVELNKHIGNVHLMVSQVCDMYYQKMRRLVFVTPKSFLSYLNLYKQFYSLKYKELDDQGNSYSIGVAKIQEASVSIAKMEVGLKEEENQLKEASDKTELLLNDLEKESKKAKVKNDEVEATTKACEQTAREIATEKEGAEQDLQQALPALRRAQEAVDGLNPNDIVEMKTNRNPSDIVKYIMDLVCIFFQTRLNSVDIVEKQFNKKDANLIPFLKDSWDESGKANLNDMNFMKNLRAFEKDGISEETIELLDPYFNPKNEWFNEASAKNASKAAAGIMMWAKAIYDYHEKSKIVKPKKIKLAIEEGRLAVAMEELKKAQSELAIIQAYLGQLKENFSKQIEEKQKLEATMNKTKKKINTARTLISSLTDERDRWGKGANDINDQKKRLVGNISMAAAFISYCGPFNSDFRLILKDSNFQNDLKKKSIPQTTNLDLISFLVDDATIGEWSLQGLPKDSLSVQNALMVTYSTRYPLLIDPQEQGQNWIMNKYSESIDTQRCITTLAHPKFKDLFLKFCMEEGKTLIIEGIENEVDGILDPVLEKQIQKKSRLEFIEVGGGPIEYNKNFKLFLFCRLPNPAFSPELSAKTTIIDFTVTQGGLEQQLLGRVLSKEQKPLEDSLNQLLLDVNNNKKDLQRLDKNLLDRLTQQGDKNLLDDIELVFD